MAEIKLVATLVSKDGAGEAVREILTGLTAKSRAESGCVAYELYESAAVPGTFVTIEVWSGQDALDQHMRGLNLKFAASALREHLEGGPALHPLIAIDA